MKREFNLLCLQVIWAQVCSIGGFPGTKGAHAASYPKYHTTLLSFPVLNPLLSGISQ